MSEDVNPHHKWSLQACGDTGCELMYSEPSICGWITQVNARCKQGLETVWCSQDCRSFVWFEECVGWRFPMVVFGLYVLVNGRGRVSQDCCLILLEWRVCLWQTHLVNEPLFWQNLKRVYSLKPILHCDALHTVVMVHTQRLKIVCSFFFRMTLMWSFETMSSDCVKYSRPVKNDVNFEGINSVPCQCPVTTTGYVWSANTPL